ncbi:hypothetical protein GE09DRAFT_1143639, partial [Coniochaeta sp. 2T2.1]
MLFTILWFTNFNPAGNTTIVLIHGALVSGLYWDPALRLAATEPSLVSSAFVSGFDIFHAPRSPHTYRTQCGPCRDWRTACPRSWVRWAMDGADLPRIDPQTCTLDLCRQLLNPETITYTHPHMRHPWNRQAPQLFAQTAEAWIEGRELPEWIHQALSN